jgi:hypothetical protein
MPRESLQAKIDRTQRIITGLRKEYPDAHCELNYTNPLELLIATILSAQCTDKAVNLATPALFAKYRTASDYANANIEDLKASKTVAGNSLRSTAARSRARWRNWSSCQVLGARRPMSSLGMPTVLTKGLS